MKGLTIKKRAVVELTAEDWQLYSHMHGVRWAAKDINASIQRSFDRGQTRTETEKQALQIMRVHIEYGAMDTEPRAVLGQLLDELYPAAEVRGWR